ncbi:MAG: homocysteine S-methyltransferase family protein [Anaerolineae bacterium]|nr:homocysteine S-methyltransferase family protein [Anaerolineae bacterium]
MMPKSGILERLNQDPPMVGEGAHGTFLYAEGLPAGMLPEQWILEKPDVIRGMHQSYIDAGAESVITCTFGATRPRLAHAGLGDRLAEINRRAVELARTAAGDAVYVGGDIGPLGELLEPLGTLTFEDASDIFAEQAAALHTGGVDMMFIETMTDLNEMKAAIAGARRAAPDLPVFALMSFDGGGGRTNMGVSPAQFAGAMLELKVDAFGANCGRGLPENVAAVGALRDAAPDAQLIAKPNAGLPRLEGDRTVFDTTPEEMAEAARAFLKLGVRLLASCCGSTPAHTRAIAGVVRG